jgi:hypothetical protein
MILEALEYLLSPCPWAWRRMGYLHEQIAIDACLSRNRRAWEPHLQASRKVILQASGRCPKGGTAFLVGAGLQHDLPLADLCAHFDQVLLGDLVHRPRRRLGMRMQHPRVRCVEHDASGVLAELYREGRQWSEEDLLRRVEQAVPGYPRELGQAPALLVSASLCSQLSLLPLEWLERERNFSEGFGRRLEAAFTGAHLRWLAAAPGVRVLISDLARCEIDEDGRETSRREVAGLERLPKPEATWRWRLAPIPERSKKRHHEHVVGAWVFYG